MRGSRHVVVSATSAWAAANAASASFRVAPDSSRNWSNFSVRTKANLSFMFGGCSGPFISFAYPSSAVLGDRRIRFPILAGEVFVGQPLAGDLRERQPEAVDRKSTRLNSSHLGIS